MIPKIIHYCWLGGNPLPESAKKCIQSWKKYCPDYEIIEWNESNYDFTKIPYMKEALEAKKWGFVPDYARLDIIYQYGGIYLDVDVEVIKSYDDLLKYRGFAGYENEELINLGQGFGAEPGNQIIKKLMKSYNDLHFINHNGELNLTASPKLNSETLEEIGVKRDGTFQNIEDFVFLPTDYLCPKSFNDGMIRLTNRTYSIHHYDASWFTEEQQKDKLARWQEKQHRAKKKRVQKYIGKLANKVLGEKLSYKIKRKMGLIKDS